MNWKEAIMAHFEDTTSPFAWIDWGRHGKPPEYKSEGLLLHLIIFKYLHIFCCMIQVTGSSGIPYTLFPGVNYCPCPAYRYQVIGTQMFLTCKHILAARLAEITQKGRDLPVSMENLTRILCAAANLDRNGVDHDPKPTDLIWFSVLWFCVSDWDKRAVVCKVCWITFGAGQTGRTHACCLTKDAHLVFCNCHKMLSFVNISLLCLHTEDCTVEKLYQELSYNESSQLLHFILQ